MHPNRPTTHEPIAVVGIGCVLPDAFDVETAWANFARGHSAIRVLRDEPFEWERFYADDAHGSPDRAHSLLGARVEGWAFDWRKFRMPPAEAAAINPMQLMALEAGEQALRDVRALPRESTGVVLGSTGLGWQRDSGMRIRAWQLREAVESSPAFRALPPATRAAVLAETDRQLEAELKPVSEDNVVNAAASVAAGRINMHFDLRGPHYAVDAGFASSLCAVDEAVRLLRDGTLDCALAGGVSELLSPLLLVAFTRLSGLARTGLRAFDRDAEGTLLGEGTAMFALKRLSDALRDGDRVHALLLGVGGSSDGRSRSLVAPDAEGQAAAMRAAYADAGVAPASVGYVECHATGTPVGDASEMRALANVYADVPGPVRLGSAKPFVGHLLGAAGAVGMLRAVLALAHERVPGQIGVREVNPAFGLERSPFRVPTATEAWTGANRRAAVSAFSFGGINYHAVLEAFAPDAAAKTTAAVARPASAAAAAASSATVPAATTTTTTSSGAAATASAPARGSAKHDEPIAIVGMGGRFPGAADAAAFRAMLLEGVDTTREVPAERWPIDRYVAEGDTARLDKSYSRLGCFLDTAPTASPEWRIPPRALRNLDAGQLLALAVADEALRDARFTPGAWPRERVAVVLGFLPYQGKKFLAEARVHFGHYAAWLGRALARANVPRATARDVLREAETQYKSALPPIDEDTLTGFLGSLNAGRIAQTWDFRGPHLVVDSACASTHAAVLSAVTALRHGRCDVALTGGVWFDMQPEFFVAACRFQALSAKGIRPFADGADGFIPGEGAGVFVLKRLSDAERAGDRIHAVIRSVAGSSDGRGRSVLAPTAAGEASAIKRALAAAGLAPRAVGYVECHGTGTALGDKTEVEASIAAYGAPDRTAPLWIGSVKSNVGHLNAAAGVPALMKAVFAVRDGVIPPSLKAEPLNPAIASRSDAVRVATARVEFPAPPEPGAPRRAGVSGFGVGGSNMHLIVEQYGRGPGGARAASSSSRSSASMRAVSDPRGPDPVDPPDAPPAVAVAAGRDAAEALDALTRWFAATRAEGEPTAEAWAEQLRAQQARTTASAASAPVRVAIAAGSLAALERALPARLDALRDGLARGAPPALLAGRGCFVGDVRARAAPVVAMFPGQGSQYANMLRALAARYAPLARALDRIDAAYYTLAGRPLRPAFWTEASTEGEFVQRDEDAHCAVFATNVALYELAAGFGFTPDAVLGQSAGELSALVAAGVLTVEEGLHCVRERTRAVLAIETDDPGRMLLLAESAARVGPWLAELPGFAAIAADNGPGACIVSVDRTAATALAARAARAGVDLETLPVSHGYHSRLIAAAQPGFAAALDGIAWAAPRCAVYSTITGGRLPADAREFARLLVSQLVEPVRLRGAFEAAYADGVRAFVEFGPKRPLAGFADQTFVGREPVVTIASVHPKPGEVEQWHRLLATLFVRDRCRLAWDEIQGKDESSVSSQHGGNDDFARDVLQLATAMRDLLDTFVRRWGGAPADAVRAAAAFANVAAPQSSWPAPVATPTPPPPPSSVAAPSARPPPRRSVPPPAAPVSERPPPVERVPPIERARGRTAPALRAVSEPPPAAGATRKSVPPAGKPSSAASVALSGAAAANDADTVFVLLRDRMAEKTGYPAEMLEPDVDLEADLGIDTVKQLAVLTQVREGLGLETDPRFKLRDFPTLRKLAAHLGDRVAAARRNAPRANPATPATAAAPGAPAAAPPEAPAAPTRPTTTSTTRTGALPPTAAAAAAPSPAPSLAAPRTAAAPGAPAAAPTPAEPPPRGTAFEIDLRGLKAEGTAAAYALATLAQVRAQGGAGVPVVVSGGSVISFELDTAAAPRASGAEAGRAQLWLDTSRDAAPGAGTRGELRLDGRRVWRAVFRGGDAPDAALPPPTGLRAALAAAANARDGAAQLAAYLTALWQTRVTVQRAASLAFDQVALAVETGAEAAGVLEAAALAAQLAWLQFAGQAGELRGAAQLTWRRAPRPGEPLVAWAALRGQGGAACEADAWVVSPESGEVVLAARGLALRATERVSDASWREVTRLLAARPGGGGSSTNGAGGGGGSAAGGASA